MVKEAMNEVMKWSVREEMMAADDQRHSSQGAYASQTTKN